MIYDQVADGGWHDTRLEGRFGRMWIKLREINVPKKKKKRHHWYTNEDGFATRMMNDRELGLFLEQTNALVEIGIRDTLKWSFNAYFVRHPEGRKAVYVAGCKVISVEGVEEEVTVAKFRQKIYASDPYFIFELMMRYS